MEKVHPPTIFKQVLKQADSLEPKPVLKVEDPDAWTEPLELLLSGGNEREFGSRILSHLKEIKQPELQQLIGKITLAQKKYKNSIKRLLNRKNNNGWRTIEIEASKRYQALVVPEINNLKKNLQKMEYKDAPFVAMKTILNRDLPPTFLQSLVQAGILEDGQFQDTVLENFMSAGRKWHAGVSTVWLAEHQNSDPTVIGIYIEALGSFVLLEPNSDFFSITHFDNSKLKSIDAFNWPGRLDAAGWHDPETKLLGDLKITREQVKKVIFGQAIILTGQIKFNDHNSNPLSSRRYPWHWLNVEYFVDFTQASAQLIGVRLNAINVNDHEHGNESPDLTLYDQSMADQADMQEMMNNGQLQFKFSSLTYKNGNTVFSGDESTHSLPFTMPLDVLQGNLLAPLKAKRSFRPEDEELGADAFPFPLQVVAKR